MAEKVNIELQQTDKAINFSNELTDQINNHFQDLLLFLNEFNEIYAQEEGKLPYHVNLIDELRANENAHSKILRKLLQQQEPISKRYEVLESFLEYIKKICNHEDFCKIRINKPEITQEKERIDLWIKDNDYTIIFENKIGCAKDRPCQLERYIDKMKVHKYKEEQIYVLYLPPTEGIDPEEQTWGKYYEQDIYKNRYLNLSFRDHILPWLKNNLLPWVQNDLLPEIRDKYRFLSSAVEQYIDHLEGKFNLRAINNKMNMELQNFIKEKLGISEVEPEIALHIVSEKQHEMENALEQLESLEEEIQAKIDEKYFSKCYKELKELNLNVIRKIDSYLEFYPRSVGIRLINKLTIWIGKFDGVDGELFCQVNYNDNSKKLPQKIKRTFKEVFQNEEIEEKDEMDCYEIYAYIENADKTVMYLKEFYEKIRESSR